MAGIAWRVLAVAVYWLLGTDSGETADITSELMANGAGLVLVSGEILPGDDKRFATEIIRYNDGVVVLAGPGGNLSAGMEMGKAIRIKGFSTYVADGRACASSCALAWLGGRKRLLAKTGRIGFHAASMKADDGSVMQTSIGNALVGAYVNQLGLPSSAVVFITAAPPDQLIWLDAESRRYGIDFEYLDPTAEAPKPSPPAAIVEPSTLGRLPAVERLRAIEPFLQDYLTNFNNAPHFDPSFVRRTYAPSLTYYRTLSGPEQIIAEHQAFIERWPERYYTVPRQSISKSCADDGNRCEVVCLLEWVARSSERNAQSTGRASWRVVLEWTESGRPIIVEEDGTTLNRKVSKLRP